MSDDMHIWLRVRWHCTTDMDKYEIEDVPSRLRKYAWVFVSPIGQSRLYDDVVWMTLPK